MSMHKIPLTKTEEEGLLAHGLTIDAPSQLSDAFRQGVAYGQRNIFILQRKVINSLFGEHEDEWENVNWTDDLDLARTWKQSSHRFEHRQFERLKKAE